MEPLDNWTIKWTTWP